MTKNIYVYEGGGSNPKPLAVIDMSKYSENDSKATSAILYKKINNVFTLEIDIPTNCDASQSITNTSDLVLYDTEDNLQEFHVTEVSDLHEYSVIRTVYAEQSICELIDDIIISGTEMPTTTNPADYLAYILSFTRWSVGTVDNGIYNSKWKEDLTGKNCLEALQMFMNKYNCEFIVRYESDSKNRITGRYIDIKKTIGNNYGKRFEDTKDINALKRNLDLDSIKTAIYPRIAKQSNDDSGNSTVEYVDISTVEWSVAAGDPVNKPLGQTILVDPDADAMYKRLNSKNGKLQERIMYAEWSDQTAKDAEDLCSQAWRILRANSVLNPSYEVNASDLYKLSGNNSDYAHEQVSLGDTCIIIDRKITPELRATTRVVEIEEDLLNPINNKYVFGKYRQTLATSNVDQQKSIEEKLAELSGRIQGVTVPEVKPQYQSGKVYYEDIKGDIQNEFMSSNGYVMAEDSNGFWVMDAPQGGTPTKALILKGGNLAIATYNTATSAWEVGTFINGTSVNADYINTGHISADVIATHSITTDHLTASAVQYIRTGMATDEDLQGVIDSVTAIQTDYVTSQELNNAIDNVTGGTLTASQIKAIEDTQRQLKAEYQSLYSQANKIYVSEYLPSGSSAKNDLAAKINAYTTAYNTYNNQITSMIADNNISDEEYRTYKSNADAYATALKNLTDAMEVANDARLANVYAQAREGMVTTADLEVNNQSVIASAKAGMVSTEDMTSAINFATQDMATTTIVNTAINNATKDMATNSSVNTAVTNATKDMATTTIVNTAITNATKDMATNSSVNTAVNNAIKDKVTNTQMNSAINTATKDMATNSSVNTAVTNATKDMATNSSVNSAISNATKNMATNSSVSSAIANATKDMATNSSVTNAISNATKDMATNAGVTNAINGITVGSRNLALLTSDDWVSFSNFKGGINDCRLSYTVLTKGLSVNDRLLVAFDYKLENMTYSSGQSPEIRIQGSGNVTEWNSGQFNSVNINLSSKPANASGTAYTIANAHSDQLKNSYWSCNFRTDYITGGTVSIKGIRVIRSSKLVSWIAAPEDAYTNTVFETFKAVTAEYNNNYKIATTLYSNSYLSGTAKTNLKTAYDDYATKYNAVKTAHDAISTSKYADEGRKTAWNTALTNLQSSTTTLAQRVQEASTFINTAIYNASKNYTDKAIPDALTGYAKTSYVDSAKADAIADAKKGMVSTSQLEVNNTEILMKTASMGQYNILRNSDFRDGMNYWTTWGTDGTEPIRVIGETDTSFSATMSGERNIGIISAGTASTGSKNLGFYQDTKKCVVGVSYTVGYWINCTNCSCNVQIESLDSSDTKSVLANKSYTNINGGHDRATWKYDSITFTVPNGSAIIRFVCSLTNATNAIHRVLMVKPMLSTGINPQAWTAHPDEIHVGVVSVTEERGIMVEHSDTNSYSTLDSNGLKIWEYDKSSPVASFGESNTAYIDTVATKKLVCDTVIPTINIDAIVNLYFSSTGSGNYSGRDSSNCCAGFTGAMSELCRRMGIDSTYIHGGFNITGNGDLNFYGVGNYLDEEIKLKNIYTTVPIKIKLPAEMVQTGTFDLNNIYGQVTISGKRSSKDSNDGAIIKRNGGKEGIYVKNCSCVAIQDLRFSNTAKNGSGIYVTGGSTVFVSICDFCQFFYGIEVFSNSTVFVDYCRGTSDFYGMAVYNSLVVYNGSVPSSNRYNDIDHNIYMYGCSAKLKGTASDANTKPIGTLQTVVPVASKAVTSSFSALAYKSYRQYSITDLYQASWGGDSGFGNYRGNIFFGADLNRWLKKATGLSAQIYLQRQSSKHGNTNAKIKIEGTDVGTLALGEGKWFNVPSNVITGLKEGTLVSIELNGTGNDYFCKFEKNVILKVTGTKEI